MAKRIYRRIKRRYRGARSFYRRHKAKFTLPLAPIAGIAAPFLMASPRGPSLVTDIMAGDMVGAAYDFRERFAGIDNKGAFQPAWVMQTYTPVIVGCVIHWIASKLGINRMLGRAKVPIIRI